MQLYEIVYEHQNISEQKINSNLQLVQQRSHKQAFGFLRINILSYELVTAPVESIEILDHESKFKILNKNHDA